MAKRIADRPRHVADFDLVAIRKRRSRPVRASIILITAMSVFGSRPTTFAVKSPPVIEQRNLDLVRAIHDVGGGENVADLADDDARAEAVLLFGACLTNR